MTDLEIERQRAQLQHLDQAMPAPRLHPIEAIESIIHVVWLAMVLLGMLVTGFVSYAVFQVRTNDRLDTVEKRLTQIETGQQRILDAIRIPHRPHAEAESEER